MKSSSKLFIAIKNKKFKDVGNVNIGGNMNSWYEKKNPSLTKLSFPSKLTHLNSNLWFTLIIQWSIMKDFVEERMGIYLFDPRKNKSLRDHDLNELVPREQVHECGGTVIVTYPVRPPYPTLTPVHQPPSDLKVALFIITAFVLFFLVVWVIMIYLDDYHARVMKYIFFTAPAEFAKCHKNHGLKGWVWFVIQFLFLTFLPAIFEIIVRFIMFLVRLYREIRSTIRWWYWPN